VVVREGRGDRYDIPRARKPRIQNTKSKFDFEVAHRISNLFARKAQIALAMGYLYFPTARKALRG
jgi:hypothetical protein